ncbi:MAG: phosphoketolase family protein [Ilumatobacter sp.]|uniref:phosphoketolase family protein n=1 Tax=Ilumatobacter sp. TaxID=1967498 RepID=UPI003C766A65
MTDAIGPDRSPAGTVPADIDAIDAWWRAANYLSVGQIYLLDNPLLREELREDHVKRRLLGHWGTCPGINLVWAHLNRVIKTSGREMIFVCGPGHGGPAALANPWLEGTYSELFPDVTHDAEGMRRLFRQFSFPGGVPSHAGAPTPGSIHEGGELGYSLCHAQGAAMDRPGTITVCMIGDGEAETGALAASWLGHHFLDPVRDGHVLPILHLNGWKIANPTIFGRLPAEQLEALMRGNGYEPWTVGGSDPADVHAQMVVALDEMMVRFDEVDAASEPGVSRRSRTTPPPPVLLLRTPKGWTGPEVIDGTRIEGTFRSHQVPIGHDLGAPRLCSELERWMRSYRPEELFDEHGSPRGRLRHACPEARLRMSANATANATGRSTDLDLPTFDGHLADNALASDGRRASAMAAAGTYLRDVIESNPDIFRLFGPDEVASNRLSAVFDATERDWQLGTTDQDEHLATDGRVIEVLSEHLCEGWLEAYTLTGRHGLFTSYEAFIHVVDSMFNQHAKWLASASDVEWRRPVPSLNYLLSSHVWRQDHNGFSHQDPGFLDIVANKRAEVVRIYLPPDANSLIATLDRCLRSRHRVNVVIAGKQPEPQYLGPDEAIAHVEAGAGVWDWAGRERAGDAPDVVLACAGDVPTMETVAAAELLVAETDLAVRVVNVTDLMVLQSNVAHPHGLDHRSYDDLFPPAVPTVFAFHGYPSLIHQLTYDRHHHDDLHVHGFDERGSTTTPFDMCLLNRIDRYHLAIAAVEHQPGPARRERLDFIESCRARIDRCRSYILEYGDDPADIAEWLPAAHSERQS